MGEPRDIQESTALAVAVGGPDDPTNDERFGVTALPSTILIDRRGIIATTNGPEYHKLARLLQADL
jgi:hypothetical protein